MSVDTKSKRSAALRFGMSHLSGTRPPSGSISAFDRAALLGCYSFLVDIGDPTDGWMFGSDETVWTFGSDSAVWMFGPDSTVWSISDV